MYKLGLALILLISFGVGVNGYANYLVDSKIHESQKETEGTIKDAVKSVKDNNPSSNPNISLERLRNTLSNW